MFDIRDDGEIARVELGGRRNGEMGILIASAGEVEYYWRACLNAVRYIEADANFGRFGGVGVHAQEHIEGFVLGA